jgi:hypothetical protein
MMIRRLESLAILLLAGAVPACSSTTPGSVSRPIASSHNVLSENELQAAPDRTLYDAIQRLKPSFFRSRQVRSNTTPEPEPVHVFVDGMRAEGLNALKLFTPQNIKEARFYEPHEANVRFGTGHHGGLIAVIIRH